MQKKLFYSFIILAVLFGAFGVMGKGGVTPVQAAAGFNPGAASPLTAHGAVNNTPLPHFESVPAGDFSNSGIQLCDQAGVYQLRQNAQVWAGFAGDPSVSYFRIRVNPQGADGLAVAVVAQDPQWPLNPLGTDWDANTIACSKNVAAGAPIDMVVQIPANTPVYVVVGRQFGYAAPTADVDVYIQRTMDPSGGLIIQTDSHIPHPNMTWLAPLLGVDAQVYNKATGEAQRTIVDEDGIAWFDVSAGIYNVGFWDQIVPFAARYSDLVAGGWYARQPLFDTFVTATGVRVRSATPAGAPITLQYNFRPDDAEFAWDFDLGARGILIPDDTLIFVTPGPWTVNGYLEQVGQPDYNLYASKMVDSFLYTMVDFRLHVVGGVNAARVQMCVPINRDNAVVHTQVGAFEPKVFSFYNGGLTSPICPLAGDTGFTQGGYMYLTTGVDYNLYAEVHETGGGALDQYFLNPLPYPFPITTAGVNATQWGTIFANKYASGDTFASGVAIENMPLGSEFVMPVTEDIVHTRDIWTDGSGNQLFKMILDGTEEFPVYTLTRGLGGVLLNLAQDWELTPFAAIPPIGRYAFDGVLPTGGNGVTALDASVLYAVSPTDTRMRGHWAWSWVMALYEMDYTTGIDANNYGPDMEMSREEMAAFLSRIVSDISNLPAAGTATGTVFSDVSADFWAADDIEFLADLGITNGYGDGSYGVGDMVKRDEMSKFLQLTFRSADLNGAGIVHWDTGQNVLAPGTHFVDVPANHWANLWIEEMWFDGLTDGCRTEMSGLAFIHYYCPDGLVTRGQMAKFLNTALQPDVVTQWDWPVLSPER